MNEFTCRWINRLDQFGSVSIDLIVAHDQGIIPSRRISKNYHMAAADVDVNFLQAVAEITIDEMVWDWNLEQTE